MFIIIGFITVDGFGFSQVFSSMGSGASGMFETIIVAILLGSWCIDEGTWRI